MGNHRVVSVEKDDEQDGGGYVITAVDTKAGQKDEVLSLQVKRLSDGFGKHQTGEFSA